MLEGVITGGYLFFTMSINLKKNNTLINNTSNRKKKGINGVSKEKHLFRLVNKALTTVEPLHNGHLRDRGGREGEVFSGTRV